MLKFLVALSLAVAIFLNFSVIFAREVESEGLGEVIEPKEAKLLRRLVGLAYAFALTFPIPAPQKLFLVVILSSAGLSKGALEGVVKSNISS